MEVTADKNFTVNAPVDKVWELLSDPSRVVVCVQGAQLTEIIDEQDRLAVRTAPLRTAPNSIG